MPVAVSVQDLKMLQIFFRSYENTATDSWAALPDLHFVFKLITALNSTNSGFQS